MAKSPKKIAAGHIESSKIDARLRMFANGSQQVNEIRAELCGSVAIKKQKKPSTGEMRFENPAHRPKLTRDLKKKKLTKPSTDILTNVFVELIPGSKRKVEGEVTRKGNLVSAQVSLTKIRSISSHPDIIGIEHSRVLKFVDPIVTNNYVNGGPKNNWDKLRKEFKPKNKTLIGIIDVGGFDFAHPEFLTASGKTRFYRIWDQGSNFRKPPGGKSGKYGYGSEFLQQDLNNALVQAKKVGVPATSLEKQSQMEIGSHATHVASIAAGNSGVFPDAEIIGVTIALKESDYDRRKSFYDSSCLVHALEYMLKIAEDEKRPISINISLGTNGHAHDGSDITSRWIDSELALPGRSVCVAAGNAGQEKALTEKDYGYVMGRIHTSGRISANGLSKILYWNVVGNGIADMSENEMELWYPAQDRFSVMVKPPGLGWIGPVQPNQYIENRQLSDGTFVSIYNDLYHFSNGGNYISIFLSPNLNPDNIIPVKAGTWQVRIIGDEIRDGRYDGWIERDDPRPLGANGNIEAWNFPSFFSEISNVDNSSISSLACARNVIAVGNCDELNEKINISSSQGPTRDNRNKPEIIAPGTDVIAAKGFSSPDDLWISMTGTSMASPYVCGVAAWMLSLDSNLSAAQVQGIIIRTSLPLPGGDYAWKNDTGFGFINPRACLEQALKIRDKKDITDEH